METFKCCGIINIKPHFKTTLQSKQTHKQTRKKQIIRYPTMKRKLSVLVLIFVIGSTAANYDGSNSDSTISGLKMLQRLYHYCEQSDDLIKCLKIHALKFTDRALKSKQISLFDGIAFIRDESDKYSRAYHNDEKLTENLQSLSTHEIDRLLIDRTQRFLDTHKVQLSVPRLFADENDSESRGHKHMKKYIGPLLAALTLKSGLLAMSFKAVALLAGKALLVGKIALVLTAILGLKKLLSHEGHEKTTYEIVKHPHVSHAQTYSSSNYGGGEYETSGVGGHYHRSINENQSQDRAYRSYIPNTFQ
ncbi:uncharacterized protein LOC123291215 [Chrysoperla carnea]|uniref:uncharacterized protein LOC123291215 n=1 Tax=Chrysoperla carnea TaxID=189513 RepID=UPI001D07DA82|nr:uncharacterized protein LOC123291215 [Chrysoperla carnea]